MISEEAEIKIRSVTLLDSKTREIRYVLETWEVRITKHCGLWGGKNRGAALPLLSGVLGSV